MTDIIVSRYDRHIITDRLSAMGLPLSEQRINFVWWVENVAHHVFDINDYKTLFDAGNAYKTIHQYIDAGYLTKHYHEGTFYYVSSFVTSNASPFKCKCCNSIDINKLLITKQDYTND